MEEEIKLRAHTSALLDQSGYARVHSDVNGLLNMQDKEYAQLINDKGDAIIVRVAYDGLIQKDHINLGRKDLEKMEIEDGALITMRPHVSVGDSIGKFKDKMVDKIKKNDTDKEKGDE